MEWWNVFFKARRAVFIFISIASLGWAIVLSVYLARMWSHLILAQRIMVLAIIGANAFTAVLLYLMAVVIFRVWLDLARVVFLLLIHVASAVMLTLFGSNFSCDTFKTKAICKHIDLAFVVGSWVMTGLLLGYIPYLLIMIRVPRPIPQITRNLLLDSPTMSRPSSISSFGSISSTTRLLRAESVQSNYSTHSTRAPPKKLFIANDPFTALPGRGPSRVRRGASYGAMGSPGGPPPITPRSRAVSVTPPTPEAIMRPAPASLQTAQALAQSSMRTSPRPLPTPPVFINPFLDPLSRHNTPNTAFSQSTFVTAPDTNGRSHSRGYSDLEQYPPLVPLPNAATSSRSQTPTLGPGGNVIPTWSPYEGRWTYSSYPERPMTGHIQQNIAGSTIRQHTATPHSIHSVTPSMHFHDSIAHASPAQAHTRASSDPIYRPATVAPDTYIDPDAPLPNPFPLVSSIEVRRFGSVPSAQFYTGQGGTYRSARNAAHLAAAMGRTPPRSEGATMDPKQWQQLVFTAATGRTV